MSSIVQTVARKLGGQPVLGHDVRSQADLALAVRRRLPLAILKGLAQAGLTEHKIERFVIPQRTRRHRADRKQPLTIDDSDRAVRLLPPLTMVRYDVPDDLGVETIGIPDLTASWRLEERSTQERGDRWYAAMNAPLLHVPSAVVPLDGSPDQNVLINHAHPAAVKIRIAATEPFVLEVRLF